MGYSKNLEMIGWREWVSLPNLNVEHIKAKVDTGARTSALHAFYVERFKSKGKDKVKFKLHPIQKNNRVIIECEAELYDVRNVSDSGGHREDRYVIFTPIMIGDHEWPIEITLTNRDTMNFRMLLGRTALKNHFIINPSKSYLLSDDF